MKWIQALKDWNSKTNKGKWCIPRKGSSEYDDVKKIMSGQDSRPYATGGYINFSKQLKPKIKKEQPNLSDKEIASIVAKKWKSLSDIVKKSFA